jgi:diguanylate cyclase (GGDEF)-like protein
MRYTLDRLLDSWTPANRCLLAVLMSFPFFVLFWLFNGAAFLNAEVSQGVSHPVMVALQSFLTVVLVISVVMGAWLWTRRSLPDRVPGANLVVTFNIALGYLALVLATGAFTTGLGLVLLGVLAVGLLLFSVGTILRIFIVCVLIHTCQDVLVMAGWLPYAPLLNAQAFEGGLPSWWFSIWQNMVFYLGWAIILTLVFVLFTRLDGLHLQLAKLSYTDVLTGLSNRRYFMERLTSESRRYVRSNVPYSLILLDVDHFKSINDRHGHHAGDEVLCRLAQILTEGVRTPTDQPARIGGEEFAVLLPDTSLAATEIVCRRIAEGLRQHTFNIKGESFHLTISMGVVECRGEPIEEALKQADRNLYQAKQGGRDQAIYSMVTEVAT